MQRRIGLAVLALALVLPALFPGVLPRTAPGSVAAGTSFTFAAVGDLGATQNTTADLQSMSAAVPTFSLGLGDLSYGQLAPESAWCGYVSSFAPLGSSSSPVELLSGNHDMNTSVNGSLIDNFVAPGCLPDRMNAQSETCTDCTFGKEYYFDYPSGSPLARFIMISPNLVWQDGTKWSYTKGDPHYNWVDATIKSARSAGIPWVIVGMHEDCLSTGWSTPCEVGNDIMNLLIQDGVDLVLEGHDHSYQRGKQLALNSAAGCSQVVAETYNYACVADTGASGTYTKGKGTVIVIDGTGGIDETSYGTINPCDNDNSYFATEMGGNLNARYGYMLYTVSPSQISARFVGTTSSSTYGDQFAISAASFSPPIVPIFSDNFDGETQGALQAGSGPTHFSSVTNSAELTVENTVSDCNSPASSGNGLMVTLGKVGSAYAAESYSNGYLTHELRFHVALGGDFVQPSGDSLTLAETKPNASSGPGKVDLIRNGDGSLSLIYWDRRNRPHTLHPAASLLATDHSYHLIDLREIAGNFGGGKLSLLVDGSAVGSWGNIDATNAGIGYVAVGQILATSTNITGHLYIDDVETSGAASVASFASPVRSAPLAGRAVRSRLHATGIVLPRQRRGGRQALTGLQSTAAGAVTAPVASLPASRDGLGAAFGPDGRIYTIGGCCNDGDTPINIVEAYDPTTNTWICSTGDDAAGCRSSTLAPMPTVRQFMQVVAGQDGKIYAIGGEDRTGALSTVEAYDPRSNRWTCSVGDTSPGCAATTLAPMPTPRTWFAATRGLDGRIYALGGYNNSSGYLATVEAYDPRTNTWATLPAMPTARGYLAAATTADGRIVAIGGYDDTTLTTVEAFSPRTNTWTALAPLPAPRGLLTSVTGLDGRIYVIGGVDLSSGGGNGYLAIYDPHADRWREVRLPAMRWNLAAAMGSNGTIYTLGGQTGCCVVP